MTRFVKFISVELLAELTPGFGVFTATGGFDSNYTTDIVVPGTWANITTLQDSYYAIEVSRWTTDHLFIGARDGNVRIYTNPYYPVPKPTNLTVNYV